MVKSIAECHYYAQCHQCWCCIFIVMLSVVMLNVVMPSVIYAGFRILYSFAECNNAECHYAGCRLCYIFMVMQSVFVLKAIVMNVLGPCLSRGVISGCARSH